MIEAPKDQNDYVAKLAALDAAILDAKRLSHAAMLAYRTATQKRDRAVLLFETDTRPSFEQCLKEVSATQRAVATGEIPYQGPEERPGPSVVDRFAWATRGASNPQSAGGGSSFRRGYVNAEGRHIRGGTLQTPRTPPRVIPSTGRRT